MSTYNDIGIGKELDWARIRKLFIIGVFAGDMVLIGDMLLGWGVADENLFGLARKLWPAIIGPTSKDMKSAVPDLKCI